MWEKDVAEYCKTCDRCQKANKSIGKRLGNIIKIQEPRKPCNIVHMDWVTGLAPGGDRSYNAFVVIVDRFCKTQIFLPCHKDDTAMYTALLICNEVISWTFIFTNIIRKRDPKFTSAIWTNIYQLFGTNLSFSTAYYPQTDVLGEMMIQAVEDMVRRFCAYGLEFKDCDGFNNEWCTLLPEVELEYNTSIHASTHQTPAIIENGWNPKLPQDSLKEDWVEIHPTDSSFKGMLEKAWNHAIRESFSRPFVIKALHGEKEIEVEFFEELRNKHPTFPVSLVKPYKSSDSQKFPLRNKNSQHIPSIESSGTRKIAEALKERKLRTKKVRQYLVRYSVPTCEDEWLAEKDIPEATKLLRRFRDTRNNNITR
ncbi:hypothetical protein O181_046426 [Austropuccinia psidii MF-1]|uniref:Integrase catalytic domain-containing protein n=1 Tax=Austropuccinia psidii MF-1 TaxID=1389203 RepID=A0A9Q3HIM0_9BASI|nr:hypothetical protein [Austropuccinia psidii MF-1]